MPCYMPYQGYRARYVNENGKRPIVFNWDEGFRDLPVTLPCRKCVGCRLKYSREWAIRCMHETSFHKFSYFITLTYDDSNLPYGMSLKKDDVVNFIKRLKDHAYRQDRKVFCEKNGLSVRSLSKFDKKVIWNTTARNIKYYQCGEYGSKLGRPHHHMILYGFDFPDKKFWERRDGNYKLYRSSLLEDLWPFGFSSIGSVTFDSAAYVARYIMKKQTGPDADDHYFFVDKDTGEVVRRVTEYATMSKGIGKRWIQKYGSDVYSNDFLIFKALKVKPPKYYDNLYELDFPHIMENVKKSRKEFALSLSKSEQSRERLDVIHKCKKAMLNRLERRLE